MKVFLRKIRSVFILIFKKFSVLFALIQRTSAFIKCLFVGLFKKERKTYINDASQKLKEMFPDNASENVGTAFDLPVSKDLSVIIAAYNVEKYVAECLDSILNQKTKYSVEIIIVNDGSTDSTAERIKPYLSDDRVKYFEQENAGQSSARNFALKKSVGRYIMVVDSDDVIADGSIDLLMDAAIKNRADIAEAKTQMFLDKPMLCANGRQNVYKPNCKKIATSVGYSVAKVYKRELWENVCYPVGYIFEDKINKFVLKRKAEKLVFIDANIYGYRVGIQSSSHSKKEYAFLSSLRVLPKIWEQCDNNGIKKDKTFYMLSLDHIALLNYVCLKNSDAEIKNLAFSVMQDELNFIKSSRPKSMPILFRLLDRAIRKGQIEKWQYLAATVSKYNLLKHYREIN